jgi:hypothetical protein
MNSPQRQTERIFTTEAQRRGEKQSPNRRAQRWQRPQREDPLGDQRLSAFSSRQSSRLRARSSQPTKNEEKQGFTTEAQRRGEKQSPNRRAQRWQSPQREDPLGDQRLSAFGSRQSSRLRARSSQPMKNEEKQIFTTEAQRHGGKQSPNRRTQRWQRPQRKDPLGDQRLSAFGSRESSRLRARSSQPTQDKEKQGFTTETRRHGRNPKKKGPDQLTARWKVSANSVPSATSVSSDFSCVPLCLCVSVVKW